MWHNKVYFPNFTMVLYRANNLLANQAAFRIPPHINKLDVKNFLEAAYNVKVKSVVTFNFVGDLKFFRNSTTVKLSRTPVKTRMPAWKKAIVTLDKDEHFQYPPLVEYKFDLDKVQFTEDGNSIKPDPTSKYVPKPIIETPFKKLMQ